MPPTGDLWWLGCDAEWTNGVVLPVAWEQHICHLHRCWNGTKQKLAHKKERKKSVHCFAEVCVCLKWKLRTVFIEVVSNLIYIYFQMRCLCLDQMMISRAMTWMRLTVTLKNSRGELMVFVLFVCLQIYHSECALKLRYVYHHCLLQFYFEMWDNNEELCVCRVLSENNLNRKYNNETPWAQQKCALYKSLHLTFITRSYVVRILVHDINIQK